MRVEVPCGVVWCAVLCCGLDMQRDKPSKQMMSGKVEDEEVEKKMAWTRRVGGGGGVSSSVW